VQDIRALCDRQDPELKAEPRTEARLAPVVGMFVDLITAKTPTSKVNEYVRLEVLNCALTNVDKPWLEPRGNFGTIVLVEIQEQAS